MGVSYTGVTQGAFHNTNTLYACWTVEGVTPPCSPIPDTIVLHLLVLIYRAMKDARLMVNKCLLLNIIKATKADSTLER